jgi:hypothetical protein
MAYGENSESGLVFTINEFNSTISMNDIITYTGVNVLSGNNASFNCDMYCPLHVFKDLLLFYTPNLTTWNSTENLEKLYFIVNRSKEYIDNWNDSWIKNYNIGNIGLHPITDNVLIANNYSTYDTSVIKLERIYCAWYMYKITNGMKNGDRLIKNIESISTGISDSFKTNVWNTLIDNVFWHYDYITPSVNSYLELYPSSDSNYILYNNKYNLLTNGQLTPDVKGIQFRSDTAYEELSLPQKIFQILSTDATRFNIMTLQNITPDDTIHYNSSSKIPLRIITNDVEETINNKSNYINKFYKFPFKENDIIQFKLNIKVNTDNTLRVFHSTTHTNRTVGLNSAFNAGNIEGETYLSFLVRINLW